MQTIILGAGGVGSSAAMHLARRGAKVLGFERFSHGHDRGSSHGQSRAIRMAYFEHPDYVPLLRRAYELWFELERATRQHLFHQTGLLEIGPRDGAVVPGVLRSKAEYDLPIDELSRDEVKRRWPNFVMPEGTDAVFERNAGFLLVEDCVHAHLAEARRYGADFRENEAVQSWQADGAGVRVTTDRGRYRADRLIIAAGAWASQTLAELNLPLEIRRKHLHWYRTKSDAYLESHGTPTFFFELPESKSFFYGFPQIDARGVKVAEHTGGEQVENPAEVDRSVDSHDRARIEDFLRQHLLDVAIEPTDHAVCFYTMTPDENFIVDRHPLHPQVMLAAGLSGHGFKFTSVLGEVLAELALEDRAALPIEFLSISRPALRR